MRNRTVPTLLLLAALTAACTAAGVDDDRPDAVATAIDPSERDVAVPGDDVTAAPTPDAAPSTPAPSPTPSGAPRLRAAEVLAAGTDGPVRFRAAFPTADDEAALAAVLTRTDEAVRDEARSDAAREEAAFEGQLALRQLAATPAWRDAVLGALPDRTRRFVEAGLAARDALDALRSERPDPTELPAWEVVPPAPADELVAHYREAADVIGVEWEYLAAINLVETRMGRIRGTSTAGARGPMQFIPASWEEFGAGADIEDDRDAIFAAARHLRERGWDQGPREALFRYNNSTNYVDATEAYALLLREDPGAYRAYHGWQVLYATAPEVFVLPVGYRETERVPLDDYLDRPVVEVVG